MYRTVLKKMKTFHPTVIAATLALLLVVVVGQFDVPITVEAERAFVRRFTEDSVALFCNDVPNEQFGECAYQITGRSRSYKFGSYVKSLIDLNDAIGLGLSDKNWTSYCEGSTTSFLEKIQALQEAADDKRVHTICEVGFNAGYSALNFLLANPLANFISFDIFRHNYTAVAVNAIQEMFPDRNIVIVAGDSGHSVSKMRNIYPDLKCNLMFVDGGHLPEHLEADLTNMMGLADPSFNRVLIDDLDMSGLHSIWNTISDRYPFKKLNLVTSKQVRTLQFHRDEELGLYRVATEPHESNVTSIVGIGSFV